jgi:hypothetical protein
MVSGQGDDAALVMFNPRWLEEKQHNATLENLHVAQKMLPAGMTPSD